MGTAHRATVLPEHTKNMLRLKGDGGAQTWDVLTQEDLWGEGRIEQEVTKGEKGRVDG